MSTQDPVRREPDGRLAIAAKRYDDGPTLSVADRWTGEPMARVVMADAARAEEAIAACVVAFERTRAMKGYERRDLLRRAATLIATRKDALATLLSREAGKPITQALAEVTRAVSTFEV